MKHILLAMAIVAMLASCQDRQTGEAGLEQPAAAVDAPVEAPIGAPEDVPFRPAPLAAPVDGVFQTPLPEGVVLAQPHHARMDIAVPNKNGAEGRRTEFEYLEGDAVQAMQAFASSMAAAGFTSEDGPSVEGAVVRQVFGKAGYCNVFARAQPLEPGRKVHDSALGFVVVAWPAQNRISQR